MLPINNAQVVALMRLQQMQQILQVQQLMQINNTMQGSPIVYQQPQQQQLHRNEDSDEEDDKVMKILFCANLDERVDEETLYELFIQAGPLECVNIPDKRNFAFIEYVHKCSPAYAMNLFQGVQLYGRPLVIKYQSTTVPPRLAKLLLPPDWGVIKRAPQTSKNNDVSAMRRTHFNPFSVDTNMSENQRNSRHTREQSPNRRRSDGRDNNRERMGRERPHGSSGSNDHRRDNDRHYEDRKNNSHHNSDKRSNHYS